MPGTPPEGLEITAIGNIAQLDLDTINIVGVYLLKFLDKTTNQVVHKVQHMRCSSGIVSISDFVPNKDGFETDQRIFVPKSELPNKIEWLQHKGGTTILNAL